MSFVSKVKNKKTLIAILIVVAALILSLFAFSLPKAIAAADGEPSPNDIDYTSILYDNTNGLPTSEANAIVQSADGYIWIGGYSGLIRYDGNEFYRYDSATTGIASVLCLYIDKGGKMWIGTNDSGAVVFEKGKFSFYDTLSVGLESSVRSIAEDGDGNIYLATTSGLAIVDGDGNLSKIDDERINKYIYELSADGSGTIYGYIYSGSGEIFSIKNKVVASHYTAAELGITSENIYTVYADPENADCVYIGTQASNVYHGRLDDFNENATALSVSPQYSINRIRVIRGQLWVCTSNGVGYFRRGESAYNVISDLPMTNSFNGVMLDYENNLWFTSDRQGVMKIVETPFKSISQKAGLTSFVVNSTCMVGGELYLGTDGGVTILDENYALKTNALTEALAGTRIRCIKLDGSGHLWLASNGKGLISYDPTTDTVVSYTVDEGILSNYLRAVTVLSDGLIAAVADAGITVVKNGAIVKTYADPSITGSGILTLAEGENGKLFVGSNGGGLYILDGDDITFIGVEEGLKSGVILRVCPDPVDADVMWLVTSNSIAYLKGKTVTTVENFPYSNNFDLYFDINGRMIVLSSNGIYVVNRSQMYANGAIDYTLYDIKGGLPGTATANSYSYLDDDGNLFVSSSVGVYSFNINDNTNRDGEIKLSVPFITVDDETIWLSGENTVHIPSDSKRLSISANAFMYTLNDPHLTYYLEGFDRAPISVTKRDMTQAVYTNLAGGTYVYHLSVINIETGEVVKTITLTIIKDKAIYEQVWFWVLIGLLFLGLLAAGVVAFYKTKTKKLIAKQEENKKLIKEMNTVFARCIDLKDTYTNGHSTRVAAYTAMIAEKLGKSPEEVEDIRNMALLHDIGKISIPDAILNKPGRLTDEEYVVMKTHASRGYEILKDITIAPGVAQGAGFHHEKYDGTGYPNGLKGDEIPEVAQIIAVADAFDAMYSTRPYRRKMPLADIVAEIKRCSGTQFNPKMVEAFLKLIDEGAFSDADRVD